jgi:hypothetical protein
VLLLVATLRCRALVADYLKDSIKNETLRLQASKEVKQRNKRCCGMEAVSNGDSNVLEYRWLQTRRTHRVRVLAVPTTGVSRVLTEVRSLLQGISISLAFGGVPAPEV